MPLTVVEMTDTTTVAVLGTGIMGAGMARNLLRAGLDVRVWNRSRNRAVPLADDGAVLSDSAANAVDGADVVITMLADGDSVREVITSAAGSVRPGTVWAQMSTVGLAATVELAELAAEHDLVFVDAPVLGTRAPAESGQLTVLAAGPDSARDALAPVFDAVGSRTVWLDGVDGATRLKLVLNSWVLALTGGIAESVGLAEGLGVDPHRIAELVAGGPLDCGYLHVKSRAILERDFTPSFATRHAEKDAGLIVAAARDAGVRVDLAEAGRERFRRAAELGHGDDDMAASYFASRS